jgi:hypothetical protein
MFRAKTFFTIVDRAGDTAIVDSVQKKDPGEIELQEKALTTENLLARKFKDDYAVGTRSIV